MINTKELAKIAHLATSEFIDRAGCNVEIYRSIDKRNTGIYFGPDKLLEAEFEVVIFGYKYNKQSVYIRYPETDFYVEMIGGGGSSRGSMEKCHFRNILKEKIQPFLYKGVLKAETESIYKHDNYAVYNLGSLEFNFLKRIANFNSYSYGDASYGNEYIVEMLNRKFIPVPSERVIAYSFLTENDNIIIVDQDAHNFTYETMRCFYGKIEGAFIEVKMNDFQRYRDGGTTLFDFMLYDKKYSFYCPPGSKPLNKPTLNDVEMVPLSKELLNDSIKFLNINLASEVYER